MIRSLVFILLSAQILCAQYTLRVATYNLLNYDGNDRNDYFETVVEEIDPDIIVVQEIETQSASDMFKNDVLDGAFFAPDFHDGPTTDNQLFYNPFELKFHSASYISTSLRDIAEYKLEIASLDEVIYIYSVHLKASSGNDNEQQRLAEAEILREHLNAHPAGTNFIVAGDFNVYTSNEPAYRKLTGSETDNNGRLFDPINRPGDWHTNSNFASIHTQSTRTTSFGEGSTGGMDDRFDFILVSESLTDIVQSQTYTAFGNDGNHYNTSIINGNNSVVSAEVATALHEASDHLPVYVDFLFDATSLEAGPDVSTPSVYALHPNYPNPFNPQTTVRFSLPKSARVQIRIYDAAGREVAVLDDSVHERGNHEVIWNAGDAASGVYFCEMRSGEFRTFRKLLLIK